MKRLWSIRLYREYNVWHWADHAGWGTGHSNTRFGALLLAIKGERSLM